MPPIPASSIASTSRSGGLGSGGSVQVKISGNVYPVGGGSSSSSSFITSSSKPSMLVGRPRERGAGRSGRRTRPRGGGRSPTPGAASTSRRSGARRARGTRGRPRGLQVGDEPCDVDHCHAVGTLPSLAMPRPMTSMPCSNSSDRSATPRVPWSGRRPTGASRAGASGNTSSTSMPTPCASRRSSPSGLLGAVGGEWSPAPRRRAVGARHGRGRPARRVDQRQSRAALVSPRRSAWWSTRCRRSPWW